MQEKHFGPLWFLPGDNRGRYPFCNAVYVEGAGVLIDPGSNRSRLEQLRSGPGVREVWLTHWHEDHFTNLDLFDDVPLVVSEPDAPMLATLDAFLDGYGLEGTEQRTSFAQLLEGMFHFRPRVPARTFRSEEWIDLGVDAVQVLPTPGHTPGHVCFQFRRQAALVLGDYDLTPFGPWYGDPGSSIAQTRVAVAQLREVPARLWIAAHEKGVFESEPGPLWDDYLRVIETREQKLLAYLDSPRTMAAITEQWITYGRPREPRAFYEFAERATMTKHLEQLVDDGRVTVEGQQFARVS